MRHLKDRGAFILLGVLSSLLVLFAYWYRPSFLLALDLKATDAMFAARGESPAPDDVVIVAVDEKSVNALGRWPWPRKKTALLVGALKPARVAALDMVFSEEEDPASDKVLSDAIKDSGNVVLGYFFRNDSTENPKPDSIARLNSSKISFLNFLSENAAPDFTGPEFGSVEANTPLIGRSAAGFGAFNALPETDGIYRKAHLSFKWGPDIYPSLPLEAVRRHLKGDIVLNMAQYGMDSLEVAGRKVPLDEQGAFSLNFYGRAGSFRTLSAVDVINGNVPPEALRDRLVFVGVTEKAVYDIRPTPMDSLFPGVEIHATVAGNILQGRYLIRDARVVLFDLVMVALMPLMLSAVISRLKSTFASLGVFAGLFTALIAGEFLLFSRYSVNVGVVFPALSLIAAYLSEEAYRNLVIEKRSRYLRKAFSTYVSSQLVSEILKDPGRLKLGGEKRVITVLFSDIRGFTTLSERLKPEDLVALLNEYLSPMTSIVFNEEGMLDKYIGDAIMAVFNAPLSIPDHPARACKAALKMIEKLDELNRKWLSSNQPTLDIGIGINTGEAVVGNMGAELRFDYTAIGDTVNLASRLESMNKLYGTAILVSEDTYRLVKDSFSFRELDLVKVKGKERPIVMYELTGLSGEEPGNYSRSAFSDALALYRGRRFKEAKEAFEAILEKTNDGPSLLYVNRCAEYMAAPPPQSWDGVFEAKSK